MTVFGRALDRLKRVLSWEQPRRERRAHTRVPAHGTVALMWGDPDEGGQTASANVIDVSTNGLSVRAKGSIPAGAPVLLHDGTATVSGSVRHCSRDEGEFWLGIALQRVELSGPLCLEAGSGGASDVTPSAAEPADDEPAEAEPIEVEANEAESSFFDDLDEPSREPMDEADAQPEPAFSDSYELPPPLSEAEEADQDIRDLLFKD